MFKKDIILIGKGKKGYAHYIFSELTSGQQMKNLHKTLYFVLTIYVEIVQLLKYLYTNLVWAGVFIQHLLNCFFLIYIAFVLIIVLVYLYLFQYTYRYPSVFVFILIYFYFSILIYIYLCTVIFKSDATLRICNA